MALLTQVFIDGYHIADVSEEAEVTRGAALQDLKSATGREVLNKIARRLRNQHPDLWGEGKEPTLRTLAKVIRHCVKAHEIPRDEADKPVLIEWAVPTERQNSSPLVEGDIDGYILRWRRRGTTGFNTKQIFGADTTKHVISKLAGGTYDWQIAAANQAEGRVSNWSTVQTLVVA